VQCDEEDPWLTRRDSALPVIRGTQKGVFTLLQLIAGVRLGSIGCVLTFLSNTWSHCYNNGSFSSYCSHCYKDCSVAKCIHVFITLSPRIVLFILQTQWIMA